HGDVLMWLMKTLLTSGCTNQRGAGHHHFADSNLPSAYIIEQMHSREGYTEKSCRSRLSKARKVIREGLSIEALALIADSERMQDSVRNDALKLISVLE
ncbi:hypothetical protein RZP82_11475, partial [Escherichia coli]|nr:hypothetical protein [Escherichia coli]MDV1696203.1 hypothetical protein [Escherichia coli]